MLSKENFMFRPSVFLLIVIMLSVSACATAAPKPAATEVIASIESDSIKLDNTSIQAGEIKFTISNNSGKGQYVIIAPAECAAEEGVSRTPTPECKERFVEHSVSSIQIWEVTVNLEAGDYVLESMVMASGPLQLSKSYFTVIAP
jgi:hypothetical protein